MKQIKSERVLVIGGAGFIGSYTVDLLLERGCSVVVLDSLEPQVHGEAQAVPAYLSKRIKLIKADVSDKTALREALHEVTAVIHQAAVVGVGQSMYEIERYVRKNTMATASLLQVLAEEKPAIGKLVVASSMSLYGEGAYECPSCGPAFPKMRPLEQLKAHAWEMRCPRCGNAVHPIPTAEDKPLYPTSTYAITKRDHEELALVIGRAYGIPTVALRYFNTYGPRQALSNPYTGIGAIFSARLLNDQPPLIFEDGQQLRDFIHVKDVARATVQAVERSGADYESVNVGTGRPTSVLAMAQLLANHLGKDIPPQIAGQFRAGDIRHCYADTRKASTLLGFEAQIELENGVGDLTTWVKAQISGERVQAAKSEMDKRGLIV